MVPLCTAVTVIVVKEIDLISIDETRWIATRFSNTHLFVGQRLRIGTRSEVGFGQARMYPSVEGLTFSYHHHHHHRQRNDSCMLPYFREILNLFFDAAKNVG